MTNHIQKSYGSTTENTPTIIYEDNAACVAQMETGYIKSNMTKHICPKYFYPHELQNEGEVKILQVKSCDNLADLFTKILTCSHIQKMCTRYRDEAFERPAGFRGRSPLNFSLYNST